MHFTTLFSGVRSVERHNGVIFFSYFLHLRFHETFKVNKKEKLKKGGRDLWPYFSFTGCSEATVPERIYNPITAMGFLVMFTFQLDNTKR